MRPTASSRMPLESVLNAAHDGTLSFARFRAEFGRVCQTGENDMMDATPTEEDCAKVEKVVKASSIKHFPDANIVRVEAKGAVDDHDGDPIYRVRVIYDSSFDSIPAERAVSFSTTVLPKLRDLGLAGYPVVLYVPKKNVDRHT